MKEIVDFLKNNYETILSVAAFILSLFNFIYLIYTNKKRLSFNMIHYTVARINNKFFYMFNIELINKSRLPIAVNEIIVKYNDSEYKIIKSPRLLSEKETKRNKEVVRRQEVHSAKFPVNILGLASEQKFLVMYGPEKMNGEVDLFINTNRGKISKKVDLNKYFIEADLFCNEVAEYWD